MRRDLTDRYGVERLPRYTSYPATPHFSAAVSHETYADWLGSLPNRLSASLYVHVPFCRSMCWYCGCHTTIARQDAPIVDYLAVLRREIALVANKLSCPLTVRHVHFGGGTPSIMEPAAFLDLVKLLKEKFRFTPDAEVAIEIDPRTLSNSMISTLGEAGVTRASLGVQSFDPVVQQAINRVQSIDETVAAIEGLRGVGVQGVNFDLIYGLPHQTVTSCVDTVQQCLQLRPDRMSVFGYAHVPTFKKHQRRIDEAALPDGVNRRAQAEAIAHTLTEAGYRRIGLDHYALPADPMGKARLAGRLRRNFQGYTTDQSDLLLGFGATAVGRLPQGYVQNEVVLGQYAKRVDQTELATAKGHALTPDDRLRAEIIERLMCDFQVDVGEVCRKHGVLADLVLQASPRLQDLAIDGLIELHGSVLIVADDARFLIRSVASAFDDYVNPTSRTYSRAV